MSKLIVSIIITLLLISISAIAFKDFGTTYAEETESLENMCDAYTKTVNGYFDDSKNIRDYENYVDNRFKVGTKSDKHNKDSKVTDEWIMEFVPQRLFEEKAGNFLNIDM